MAINTTNEVYVVNVEGRMDGLYLFSNDHDAERFALAAGAQVETYPLIPGRSSIVEDLIAQEEEG